MANIQQHGTAGLRNQLRSGFMHRFEVRVNAEDATLRARYPDEYQRCVQQALTAHMQTLALHSVAACAAKRAARDTGDSG